MTSIRKAPHPSTWDASRPKGQCVYCGREIRHEDGPKAGELNKRRNWHPACAAERNFLTSTNLQRQAVFDRDGGKCFDCGEIRMGWRPVFRGSISFAHDGDPDLDWLARRTHDLPSYAYTPVEFVEIWHLDHEIPLWKVVNLPPDIRLRYFGMANLRTRCVPCHARKTKKEAAERARINRLEKTKKGQPKRKRTSRPIKSRGFDKTRSRKMNGDVVPRQPKGERVD